MSVIKNLDIGCGRSKKTGCFGIDITAGAGVDLALDVTREPLPFPDGAAWVLGDPLIATLAPSAPYAP